MTLELGGKSANIVFADADLALAAASAPNAAFDNAGQDCCARLRVLVQQSAFDEFMALLEPAVRGVRVGDPLDESSQMSAVPGRGRGGADRERHRVRAVRVDLDQGPRAGAARRARG